MSEATDVSMGAGQTPSLRDQHRYLDDGQWAMLEKMEALNGSENVQKLLLQDPADIVVRINRFRDYDAALQKHVIDVVTAQVAAAKIPAPPPPPPPPTITYVQSPAPPSPASGPKPLRVTVSSFSGDENENLVFWARENELAMTAARLVDERQKVTFAISHLTGRARVWALTCETSQPGCFTSWSVLLHDLKAVFLPPNVAHRQRAAFLASAQGDRELYVYVQELRQLVASMAANAIAEDVMLTAFMENMKAGPAKAAVFRGECSTLEEAFTIALREDYIQRISRGLPTHPTASVTSAPGAAPAVPAAEPMDLSVIDLSNVDLATFDLSAIDVKALHVKCFTCEKFGHYQRDCPRNRGRQNSFRSRRGRGRGRGRGHQSSGQGDRSYASQGNESSQ